ncbi:excalibur calcium-binding domain-containing protein [Croceicoccus gelatinilyticus]|uniref:excalibur calcium-binding domain-containing protein n=1 Tax=Croceicoccus gelatinilyticus TaxID=2835536 RepID=UPI001BCA70E5|nr:excalibur calcium-binding domain-containing protein [Croceicoccus gelatinilyticus]MBS7671384.1 excalibur calcium-binding domain-containing protein [Croceicoccus gelatinilyticus]
MKTQVRIATAICAFALASVLPAATSAAHGGRLAADGCHNDKQNGGRHCHRGSNAGASAPVQRSPGGSAYYANCAAARAAGAAPVRRGQPGYGRHLDRDNDGIGCE